MAATTVETLTELREVNANTTTAQEAFMRKNDDQEQQQSKFLRPSSFCDRCSNAALS